MLALKHIVLVLLPTLATAATSKPSKWRTNATYVNDASTIAADPCVRWDTKTGAYWAYSTDGADEGWHFGIYTSPDLSTWSKVPGGAIKAGSKNLWAEDWFWAPECYYNEKTGWYFLFHAGRYLDPKKIAQHFKYPDFEEASKIAVAVSRSPSGPFTTISSEPLDYYPFDPVYHDVNLLMSPPYLSPPTLKQEGEKASLGTYIPHIDPNVFWDDDGKIWLFFSRNAYRNWVWSDEFGKYIEESNIYTVRLDDKWWNDPQAKTLPTVHKDFRDVNRGKPSGWETSINGSFPGPTRKDGFISVISYKLQPQTWENAHVYDHRASNDKLKDRRWAEGSTTIKHHDSFGDPVYFLTYSANNYQSPDYGVGYAYARSVTGPYYKSGSNPIFAQDASRNIYSTGHGSIVASPSNPEELYYTYHGRPSVSAGRYLYTSRLFVEPDALYVGAGAAAGDLPFLSGVAPIRMETKPAGAGQWDISVRSASGAAFDLSNVQNRVIAFGGGVEVDVNASTVSVRGISEGEVKLVYQRVRANATERWADVVQFTKMGEAEKVQISVPLT